MLGKTSHFPPFCQGTPMQKGTADKDGVQSSLTGVFGQERGWEGLRRMAGMRSFTLLLAGLISLHRNPEV